MANLFDLAAGLWDLLQDIDSDDEQWEHDAIELLQGEVTEKLDNCACMVKTLEGDADLAKAQVAHFQAKSAALKRRADSLKRYMADAVMELPKEERRGKECYPIVRGERYSIRVQQSPLGIDADLVDIHKLDRPFVKTTEAPMIRELLVHIKKTGEIPKGVEDALTEGKWGVRIG